MKVCAILAATRYLFQVQDVYSGKIISGLKTGDNFTVIINPSGVVMWYLCPKALLIQQQAPGGPSRLPLL